MVTLKNLAEHLGLSQATVSRALNGFPEVNQETRERVLEAARHLNYVPNLGARKLATGKSGMVGMVLKSHDELVRAPAYVAMIASISQNLGDLGYDLLINSSRQGNSLEAFKRFVASRAVDGLILNSPEINDERVKFLQDNKIPFVMHGKTPGKVNYPYYEMDNYQAFMDATSLLLDFGHKRIGLLNGPGTLAYALDREQGYLEALKLRNVEVIADYVVNTETNEDMGYQYASDWLSKDKKMRPTAVLCSSAVQALGVYTACAEQGLVIGKDLSVIAHDDCVPYVRTEHFDPPLTVTRSKVMDSCQPLAEMIVALLDGADPLTLQKTVMGELVLRRSTGAVIT